MTAAGNDILNFTTSSLAACCAGCYNYNGCDSFAWKPSLSTCYMKYGHVDNGEVNHLVTSGIPSSSSSFSPSPSPPPSMPTPPPPTPLASPAAVQPVPLFPGPFFAG